MALLPMNLPLYFRECFYDYSDILSGKPIRFNTSMTSKEILQVLNEAPEEELIQDTQQSAETAAEEDAKARRGLGGGRRSGACRRKRRRKKPAPG